MTMASHVTDDPWYGQTTQINALVFRAFQLAISGIAPAPAPAPAHGLEPATAFPSFTFTLEPTGRHDDPTRLMQSPLSPKARVEMAAVRRRLAVLCHSFSTRSGPWAIRMTARTGCRPYRKGTSTCVCTFCTGRQAV